MKKDKKNHKMQDGGAKKMLARIETAVSNEFYLEAAWLLSAVIEKKLKRMLEKIDGPVPSSGYSLEQSVKRVKHLHVTARHPLFTEHYPVGLIDEIRNWKNQRNTILKDMQDVHVSQARQERLAMEGIRLLQEWNKAKRKFKAGVNSQAD